MADKPRRDPNDRPLKSDKRVAIPLDFEQALGGLLRAGPHPAKDDELEPDDKATPPKRQRTVRKVKPSADG